MKNTNIRTGIFLMFTVIMSLGPSQIATAQFVPMPDITKCGISYLEEGFGAMQPAGWTGQFNMNIIVPAEGWTTSTGPTPTANTGPNVPFAGSHFLYLETNGPSPLNATYSIQTPALDFMGKQAMFKFKLLMYGAQTGSLQVKVLSGAGFATSTVILNRVGQQHTGGALDNWEDIFLDLSAFKDEVIKIEFMGMKGSGDLGDIGIDEVSICQIVFIPTLSEWGLIILTLLALIIGILGIHQNQRNRGRLIPVRVRNEE